MSLLAEVPGFLQVFSDGSVKRTAPEIAPNSIEPSTGYMSKDVTLEASKPITARMFIPSTSCSGVLPVLVYFHGGGFCIGSTTWHGYHHFLGDLCATAQCIVLSIDYRLAPEHRLPIAYQDCYSSLEWLCRTRSTEPWLERADLSGGLFMSGDSAGANIAHQVAIMSTRVQVPGIYVRGLMLIHPFFGSERRTSQELADGSASCVAMNDLFWSLSIPEGSNRDYFGCNFEAVEISPEEWDRFPGVVVFVAGLDFLKERGVSYVEFMRKRGVNVKLIEAEGEQHVYHVHHPWSEATRLLQGQMSEFMTAFGTQDERLV